MVERDRSRWQVPAAALVMGVLCASFHTATAHAQAADTMAVVIGRVVNDQTDQPLSGVDVMIRGRETVVRTDSTGAFRIPAPAGRQIVVLKKPGHQPFSAEVVSSRGTPMEYVLGLVPASSTTLAPVTVAVSVVDRRLQSYEAHRTSGLGGHFLSRDRFEQEKGRAMADVLVSTPGADIVRGRGGAAFYATRRGYDTIRNTLKIGPAEQARGAAVGTCYAAVVVNGIFVYRGDPGDQLYDLNQLAPNDVLAMEIYNGGATMPIEYNTLRNTCGLVVIWTK
jgi:hypothetical protein